MRSRPPGDTRRDGRLGNAAKSFSGDADFCFGYFRSVWIFEPAASDREDQIYFMVVVFIFGGGNWDWLGDVSGVALKFFNSERELQCRDSEGTERGRTGFAEDSAANS